MSRSVKTILSVIISACVLSAAPCLAQGTSMDIYEAIDLTLKNNSSLRSLRQEVIKAEAFKIQADGTLLPNLSASAYINRQKENLATLAATEQNEAKYAAATLEQTLYSGGKNSAIRRQAPQVKTMADLLITDGENSALGELFARFYNVLLQRERIKAEQSAVSTSEVHFRQVKKMNELGLANRLEVIRAAQQLATNTADLSTAKGLHEAAHISLMNYMAIPPESKRPISGNLTSPETASGDRAASLAVATANRADLHRLKEQYKYQGNQVEIEKSGLRPKLIFTALGGYTYPYMRKDEGDQTWKVELSAAVPIFDRNVTRSNVMKAEATRRQDKIALEQKELDIKSEVETAWTDIETTLRRLKASEKALELAKESLRLAEVGFREGVTPQLDLLDAQTSYTSARLDYLSAEYNHLLTIVALKVTEGTILDWAKGKNFK